MDSKLQLCEQCDNIISVVINDKETFICPVCGVINARAVPKLIKGHLEIYSPDFNCLLDEGDDKDDGTVFIKDIEEDLEFALTILKKHDFKIIFTRRT